MRSHNKTSLSKVCKILAKVRTYSTLKSMCQLLFIFLKGQLQRFDKLGLFDRFRQIENGFNIIFQNSFSFSCYKPSKF